MSTTPVNDEPNSPPAGESQGSANLATTPYYTIIILSAIGVVFLCQQLMFEDTVLFLTGLVKPLFAEGEYWRLFTASVVHGGVMHVAFNGFALFMLGRLVEVLSARANVSIVFLISALFGGFLSFAFLPDGVSVGASGGIVGLLGFLTVYSFRRRKLLSNAMFKNMVFNIVFIGFVGVLINSTDSNLKIDNYGHLGGLIAGAIYGLFQVPDDLYQDPRVAGPWLKRCGIAALVIILLTALATAGMLVTWYVVTGDLIPIYS
ncbi:MAG: rhomboid family intramembrane serine protease [Pyrinomonadaceae bacterium]|nr:rhomboid family intramembrane serine protease [Pyrinomonadaceae bacterium]